MAGTTVLVTGATNGIGKATAMGLASLGARVAIVGRDRSRAETVAHEIIADGGLAEVFVADLSSHAGVRRLADEVLVRLPRLEVLVNNVGGYWRSRHVTVDGIEHTLALNHLASFLLTGLLLPRLSAGGHGRVVTVASNVQAVGRIHFEDLQGVRKYSGGRAYNQSKLANVLFTYELARRTAGTGVTANVLHPGLVRTSFGAEDPATFQRLVMPFMRPFMKSPEQGAATSIYVASSPDLVGVTGRYFAKSAPARSSKRSHDQAVAQRLWRLSEELVAANS
jgi:NAD(P)-dependent dehydrogenase (short-subunit alcohol dehydrogenase family)